LEDLGVDERMILNGS